MLMLLVAEVLLMIILPGDVTQLQVIGLTY